MSNGNRNHAIKKVADRPAPGPMKVAAASIDCYGEDVFNAEVMKKYLQMAEDYYRYVCDVLKEL